MIRTEGLVKEIIKCVLEDVYCTHSKYYNATEGGRASYSVDYDLSDEEGCENKINKLIDKALLHT